MDDHIHAIVASLGYDLDSLLMECDYNINSNLSNGCTPLTMACKQGDMCIEFIKWLLMIGADVNVKDMCGGIPLHIACKNGSHDCLQLLLEAGAEINYDGCSTAELASLADHTDCITLLINAGFDINQSDREGLTLVSHATAKGNRSTVQYLIDNGADVNKGTTIYPLMIAALVGNDAIVALLMENGGDASLHLTTPLSAFDIAVSKGHISCLEKMMTTNSTTVVKPNGRVCNSPLHIAAIAGNVKSLEWFLNGSSCGDINIQDINGDTPLHFACELGHAKCVRLLLQHGADVKCVSLKRKTTPLHEACKNGHLACIELLIAAGADVDWSNRGLSPLYFVCSKGNHAATKLLIQAGAHVNPYCTDYHHSPLFAAISGGYTRCVQLLIDAGADIYLSYLQEASSKGHAACVDMLVMVDPAKIIV